MTNRRDFLTATAAAIGSVPLLPLGAQAQSLPAAAPPPRQAAPPANGGAPPLSDEPTEFVLSLQADPYQLFDQWHQQAKSAHDPNARAMTLCTVDAAGMPDGRMMLNAGINNGDFLFTAPSRQSAKGRELKAIPKAALVFYWTAPQRQIRVRGTVRNLAGPELEKIWDLHRRERDYRLRDLAWPQSEPFDNAEQLETALREVAVRYPVDVPLANWAAYYLTPLAMEFFFPHAKTGLHERVLFRRASAREAWTAERLVP